VFRENNTHRRSVAGVLPCPREQRRSFDAGCKFVAIDQDEYRARSPDLSKRQLNRTFKFIRLQQVGFGNAHGSRRPDCLEWKNLLGDAADQERNSFNFSPPFNHGSNLDHPSLAGSRNSLICL